MAVLRILGIDPGSRYMGYGVIERNGSRLRYIHADRLVLGNMPNRDCQRIPIVRHLKGYFIRSLPMQQ